MHVNLSDGKIDMQKVTIKFDEKVAHPQGIPQTFPIMTPNVDGGEYHGYKGYFTHGDEFFVEHPWVGIVLSKARKVAEAAKESGSENAGYTCELDGNDVMYLRECVAGDENFSIEASDSDSDDESKDGSESDGNDDNE